MIDPRWALLGLLSFPGLRCDGTGDDGSGDDAGNSDDSGSSETSDPGTSDDPSMCRPIDLPTGPYNSPEAFDRSACRSGVFAKLVPEGLWSIEGDNQEPFEPGPVTFVGSCELGFDVGLGLLDTSTPAQTAFIDDDELFFRRTRVAAAGRVTFTEAFLVCDRDPEGALLGQRAFCITSPAGETCDPPEAIRITPFGRLPGETEGQGITMLAEWAGDVWGEGSTSGESGGDDGLLEHPPLGDVHFNTHLDVDGTVAYLARDVDGLMLVDVTTPSEPSLLGLLAAEGDYWNDVEVVDEVDGRKLAFLGSASRGLIIADVTDPTTPIEVGVLDPIERGMLGVHRFFIEEVDGQRRVYLADAATELVTVWDLTDVDAPGWLATYAAPDYWAVHAVTAKDGRMFVSASYGGLFVVDMTDWANPVTLGGYQDGNRYSHWTQPGVVAGREIVLHGNEGYDAHLEVIDADPDSPDFMTKIGAFQTRRGVSIHNMLLVGDKAYIAYYQDGVRVVDLSDPTDPRQIAYYNTWQPEKSRGPVLESAVDIVRDTRGLLYVADSPRGLLVLQEHEPSMGR